jgi:hypothetical protein
MIGVVSMERYDFISSMNSSRDVDSPVAAATEDLYDRGFMRESIRRALNNIDAIFCPAANNFHAPSGN